MSATAPLDRIGVGIDTARYGHRAVAPGSGAWCDGVVSRYP